MDGDTPRSQTTVILAMSVDGKIADSNRSAARFGSTNDKRHLETQIARVDGVLFGTGTLNAYGTTLRVSSPALLQQRHQYGKPPQPVQILGSRSAAIDAQLPFFKQPVPRWLLTTSNGANRWRDSTAFEHVLVVETPTGSIDWRVALQTFANLGLNQIAVLGGGELVAALLAADLIDEFWLTICPLILGGREAPTPVEGMGFLEAYAPRLELLTVRSLEHEVFLHYRVIRTAKG
ncbi:MAG: RibD family protein [Leptolyngbyaceae cyanobacterium RU_5_1]|nr:RibD family protein [Leptolyngbyaceae cyanobacterium RU_5_1]